MATPPDAAQVLGGTTESVTPVTAPQDQAVVASPKPSAPKAPPAPAPKITFSLMPYTGPYKECDNIALTAKGIEKPEYCCNNTNTGLLKFGAVYTVTASDGSSRDCCAQCATYYETSSKA